MGVEGIVIAALTIVAQAAPGLLAMLSGKETDAEAIEAARAALAGLHPVRVSELADARRAELAALEEADRKALGSLLRDPRVAAHLSLEQIAALRRGSRIALPSTEPT